MKIRSVPVMATLLAATMLFGSAPAVAGLQAADLLVTNLATFQAYGEDIYEGSSPSAQVVKLKRQGKGPYTSMAIGMQNQSGVSDDLTLTGCASNAKVKVTYLDVLTDITNQVPTGFTTANHDPGYNRWIDINAKLTKKGAKSKGVAWACTFHLISANTNSSDYFRLEYRVKPLRRNAPALAPAQTSPTVPAAELLPRYAPIIV